MSSKPRPVGNLPYVGVTFWPDRRGALDPRSGGSSCRTKRITPTCPLTYQVAARPSHEASAERPFNGEVEQWFTLPGGLHSMAGVSRMLSSALWHLQHIAW